MSVRSDNNRMPNWLKGLLVVIVAACLLIGLIGWLATRQKSSDDKSAAQVVVSVDYDALKAKAEGTIAAKCMMPRLYVDVIDDVQIRKSYDDNRYPSGIDWDARATSEVYRAIGSCVLRLADLELVKPNERIERSAPTPYGASRDDFVLYIDYGQFPELDKYDYKYSTKLVGADFVLRTIDAFKVNHAMVTKGDAEKQAIARQKVRWAKWSNKWGNPPADPTVAKHAKTLKAQMDREGLGGEQKLIKSVYCSSTNDKKVQAAVVVLVDQLRADGMRAGRAANAVLKKLDNVCEPRDDSDAKPTRPRDYDDDDEYGPR